MPFRAFGLGRHWLYVKSCFRELIEMVSCCIASMQRDFILFAFQSSDMDLCKRLQWWPHRLSWRYLMNLRCSSLPSLPRPTYETTHHLWDERTRSLGKDNGRGWAAALKTAFSAAAESRGVRAGDQFSYKVRCGLQETHLLPLLQSHLAT